jgi:hypothetical protein
MSIVLAFNAKKEILEASVINNRFEELDTLLLVKEGHYEDTAAKFREFIKKWETYALNNDLIYYIVSRNPSSSFKSYHRLNRLFGLPECQGTTNAYILGFNQQVLFGIRDGTIKRSWGGFFDRSNLISRSIGVSLGIFIGISVFTSVWWRLTVS